MLRTIGLSTTPIDLDALLEIVQEGTEILLVNGEKEVARILPPQRKRVAGLHAGQGGWISDDFDEPLLDKFWYGNE